MKVYKLTQKDSLELDEEKEETKEEEKDNEDIEQEIKEEQEQDEIDPEEERKRKSKKVFKLIIWIFFPIFILLSCFYILLRFVGNMGIVVREYPIYTSKIQEDINGLKIVHFSDIHFNKARTMEKIDTMIELINKTNPDIVIFTGDLIDKKYAINSQEKKELIDKFNAINAKVGKYAISGDEDFDTFKEIFDNSGFQIVNNQLEKIYVKDSVIDLIAVDEAGLETTFENHEVANLTIALVHKPDLSDEIVNMYKPDIILAGHSHNGQVILPVLGAMMKKEGAKKYYKSSYVIQDTKLYISGGIGNTNYEFRLNNHPSINFYRIRINNE